MTEPNDDLAEEWREHARRDEADREQLDVMNQPTSCRVEFPDGYDFGPVDDHA